MKKIVFICLSILTTITGCRQYEITAEAPVFDVSTDKWEYAVGEPISFNFSGSPDMITFYSGEIKSDYNFRQGRTVEQGRLTMSFNHAMAFGNRTGQASLYVSTDFNGNYSSIDDVKNATWIPITHKIAEMPTPNIGGASYVHSGTIELNDLIEEGKPLYIAFKYEDDPSQSGTPVNYLVQNFKVESETELGIEQLAGLSGWQLVYEGEKDPKRSAVSTATITLRGNNNPAGVHHTVDWCISQPIPTGQVDLGPDRPLPVKGSRQTDVMNFIYEYDTPGTYEAYFVAKNANIKGSAETVKKITLTITSEDAGEFGFDVTTDKLEYKAGEAVVFNFEGKTDVISFYSGDFGNDYMYRDGRVVEPDELKLSFYIRRPQGTGANPLTVHVSNNFSGKLSDIDDPNTIWTQVPYTMPTFENTSNWYSSGELDLSSYKVSGRAMHIALRYVDNASSVANGGYGASPATYFIALPKLTATSVLATTPNLIPISSTPNPSDWLGFAYQYPNPPNKQDGRTQFLYTGVGPEGTGTNIIRFINNNGTGVNARPTTNGYEWAITKALSFDGVDIGPDQAVEIKNPWADNHYHAHVYTQPGVYHAYFIGKRGSREIVRKVEITVLP